jgi:hypothetical protein
LTWRDVTWPHPCPLRSHTTPICLNRGWQGREGREEEEEDDDDDDDDEMDDKAAAAREAARRDCFYRPSSLAEEWLRALEVT